MNRFPHDCSKCAHEERFTPAECFLCAGAQVRIQDGMVALGKYYSRCQPEHRTSDWSQAILRAKQGALSVIATFGRIVACLVDGLPNDHRPDIISNVPMHGGSRRHSLFEGLDCGVTRRIAVLAHKSLQQAVDIECRQTLRLTSRKQKRQRECGTWTERRRNVAGAYAPVESLEICGKTVLLLDDVITSGVTMRVCRQVLLEQGARHVLCLGLARTVKAARRRTSDARQLQMTM